MKEPLVSFKTAKLANEKGFPGLNNFPTNKKHWRISNLEYTHSLLQKWLREVYNIDVFIIPNTGINKEKIYCCYIKQNNIYFVSPENNLVWQNQSFILEEALEIGLQEALKLIPDKI